MQVNVTGFFSWVSGEVLNTPEPVVLLLLGGLYFVLSFGVRARTRAVDDTPRRESAPARPLPRPTSTLVTQQGR